MLVQNKKCQKNETKTNLGLVMKILTFFLSVLTCKEVPEKSSKFTLFWERHVLRLLRTDVLESHAAHFISCLSDSVRHPQTILKNEIYNIYVKIQEKTKHYSSGQQVTEEIAPLLQKKGNGGRGEYGISDTSRVLAPTNGEKSCVFRFTSSCVHRSACTPHKCSPPSRPSRPKRPRRPGGTTGYSCRHTGPSPPAGDSTAASFSSFSSPLCLHRWTWGFFNQP